MRSSMRYIPAENSPGILYAGQIIVRQPISDDNPPYISRLWKRVEFDENTTPIDLEVLEKYLVKKADWLKENLTGGRYETMLVMLKYLEGEMTSDEFEWLKNMIHDYRTSTLRHLNYSGFGLPPEGFTDLTVDNGFSM